MSIENILTKDMDRREFLEGTSRAAVGLAGLLNGCAPTLKETRQDVANQKWDCNPILPIPEEGCYVGFHYFERRPIREMINYYKEKVGKIPACMDYTPGKFHALEGIFLDNIVSISIENGILPHFKYGMERLETGMKGIAGGRTDKIIEEFAKAVAKSGRPFLFTLFKEMNWQSKDYWNHGGEPPKQFIEAWRRTHRIFKSVGANKNTIWTIHYLNTNGTHRAPLIEPKYYYPGDDVVDIISFTVCNRVGVGEEFTNLSSLMVS